MDKYKDISKIKNTYSRDMALQKYVREKFFGHTFTWTGTCWALDYIVHPKVTKHEN